MIMRNEIGNKISTIVKCLKLEFPGEKCFTIITKDGHWNSLVVRIHARGAMSLLWLDKISLHSHLVENVLAVAMRMNIYI